VTVTAGIPFSRWGAQPFIIVPFVFPENAVKAARLPKLGAEIDEAPHPFELALKWKDELAADAKVTKARIAAREGLSRARVTQIMNLLGLPEAIQKALQSPPKPLTIHSFSERRLRQILTAGLEEIQLRHWSNWISKLKNVQKMVQVGS
jgi:hypothetical protein